MLNLARSRGWCVCGGDAFSMKTQLSTFTLTLTDDLGCVNIILDTPLGLKIDLKCLLYAQIQLVLYTLYFILEVCPNAKVRSLPEVLPRCTESSSKECVPTVATVLFRA